MILNFPNQFDKLLHVLQQLVWLLQGGKMAAMFVLFVMDQVPLLRYRTLNARKNLFREA